MGDQLFSRLTGVEGHGIMKYTFLFFFNLSSSFCTTSPINSITENWKSLEFNYSLHIHIYILVMMKYISYFFLYVSVERFFFICSVCVCVCVRVGEGVGNICFC